MRRLDDTRPCGEIIGLSGICWEQDGILFNHSKVAVDRDGHVLDLPDNAPEPVTSRKDYDAMHWKHLKPLVEMYGGTWTTKDDAVKYLKGMEAHDLVA